MNELKQLQALRRVQEHAFDSAQQQLQTLRVKQQAKMDEINVCESTLLALPVPSGGYFHLFRAHESQLASLRLQLNGLKDALYDLNSRVDEASKQLIVRHKEVEKIKYLESEALDKRLKSERKKEQHHLDEVSMMLYKQRA